MQKLSIFSLLTIPLAAAACDDDPTPITISTVREPMAIAIRDGLDGAWQVPTATATGSYKLDVTGPYMVSVVCSAGDGFLVRTRQIARTPEDGRELDLECAEIPKITADVKGKVVQPGAITLGGGTAFSDTPDWDLQIGSEAGTFDLIGVSEDRIMVRRDVAISGTVDLGAIDIDQQGMALAPVALTVSNGASGEEIEAQVAISTPTTESALVHLGSPASAKIAPDGILSAEVRQSVTIVGWQEDASRMIRRDFRADNATAFALPEPLAPISFDTAGGKLVATWTRLPEHDKVIVSVAGELADGKAREHELELSQHFIAATGATSATLDTELPGYLPAWRPDLSREYLRQVQVVRERTGELASSNTATLVNAEQPLQAQPRPALLTRRLAR